MKEDKNIELQVAAFLTVVNSTLKHHNEIIMRLIEMKDFSIELYEHSINVALLALLLGMKTDISLTKQKELYLAGLLHDYGKLLIPKEIIEKKGTLTMKERKIMEPSSGCRFSEPEKKHDAIR